MKDEEYKKLMKTDWTQIAGILFLNFLFFAVGFVLGFLFTSFIFSLLGI